METNNIKLSEHFTYKKLVRFAFPSVVMMVFLSIYCIADALFVANFAGKMEFAALNLVIPVVIAIGAIGLMIGTGGSAIVAKTLGEKCEAKANGIFSMLVYAGIIFGILFGTAGILNIEQIILKLGATPELAVLCVDYGNIIFLAAPFCILQNIFQSFFVTAQKPKLGLYVIIIAGLTNIALDYIFIVPLKLGLEGAALGTALSQFAGGFFPIIYFAKKNNSLLKLGRAELSIKILGRTLINGSSEFMTNIAASVVTVIYNYQLLKYVGEDGVVAYGAIMYALFIFYAIYSGYCIGSAPLFSYNYGSKNTKELKNLTELSLKILALLGFIITLFALAFAQPLVKIFVGGDIELLNFTVHGFKIFTLSIAIGGFNVFGSAFFTALNNGKISAAISFLRTLVFEIFCVLFLPLIFGIDGIWSSVIVAEILAFCAAAFCFTKMKNYYGY